MHVFVFVEALDDVMRVGLARIMDTMRCDARRTQMAIGSLGLLVEYNSCSNILVLPMSGEVDCDVGDE